MTFKRQIVRILFILIGAYGVLVLIGCCMPNRLIFYPPANTYRVDAFTKLVATDDGEKIAVTYLAPPDTNSPTLLISHGNAENLAQMRPILEMFNTMGYGVCAYDYRSYGLSTGTPSEKTCYADVKLVYDYLTKEKGIAPNTIVSYGRSLGGAMGVLIASEYPVGGLVLESAFVSAFKVVSQVPLLPFDLFTNHDKIQQVSCPIYIMHGTADKLIPVWHGKKLFELAPEPKWAYWVEGAGHNDLISIAGTNYFSRMRTFLDDIQAKKTEANIQYSPQ
jgi:fermentation-respiration switch protein FrsA (DUF1100 family)